MRAVPQNPIQIRLRDAGKDVCRQSRQKPPATVFFISGCRLEKNGGKSTANVTFKPPAAGF